MNNVAANQTINVLESPSSQPTLPGDYNQSAKVDGGDYVLWRKTLGSSVATYSGADGNGDGDITEADYEVWRANFGNTAPGAGGAALPANSTGPELAELVSEPIAIYYATSLTFEPVPAIQAQLASIATHSNPLVGPRSLDAALGAFADSRSLGIRPAREVDRILEPIPSDHDLLLLALDRVRSGARQNEPTTVESERHSVYFARASRTQPVWFRLF
jgi:hypothetical protein